MKSQHLPANVAIVETVGGTAANHLSKVIGRRQSRHAWSSKPGTDDDDKKVLVLLENPARIIVLVLVRNAHFQTPAQKVDGAA